MNPQDGNNAVNRNKFLTLNDRSRGYPSNNAESGAPKRMYQHQPNPEDATSQMQMPYHYINERCVSQGSHGRDMQQLNGEGGNEGYEALVVKYEATISHPAASTADIYKCLNPCPLCGGCTGCSRCDLRNSEVSIGDHQSPAGDAALLEDMAHPSFCTAVIQVLLFFVFLGIMSYFACKILKCPLARYFPLSCNMF